MAIEVLEKEMRGIIILEPSGRLVLGQESMDFRGKVYEVLDKSDWIKKKWGWNTRIVLDLGSLSFLDSAGLGAIIAALTSAQTRGCEMKLANLTRKMRDLLAITKLATIFDVYDSVEAAVDSYFKAEQAAGAAPVKT